MISTTLTIDGMACSMCEAHVNDAIRKRFAVRSVKSNHRKGQCTIVSEDPLDESLLHEALDPTGYKLVSITSQPHKKKGLFSRPR